jgi:flavin-binding protein dodecin
MDLTVPSPDKGAAMGSVYKVIEIVGTSDASWEDAARAAITTASSTLRDLRVAEVIRQDVTIGEDGQPDEFRVRLSVSFKYESE